MQISTNEVNTSLTWESASFSGFQDEMHWSQSLKSGKILAAVEVNGDGAANHGHQFLKELQVKLEKTEVGSLAELKQILSQIESSQAMFNYILAYLKGNVFYLVVYGDGQAYIKRDEKIAVLKEGTGSVSGKVKSGDVILFHAGNMSGRISKSEMTGLLKNHKYDQIAQELNTKLATSETEFAVAGVALAVQNSDDTESVEEQDLTVIPVKRVKFKLFSLPKDILGKLKTFSPKQIKKGWLSLVLVLILVLAIGAGLLNQKRSRKSEIQTAELEQATHEYEEGMGLVDLNPVRARELLESARDRITAILNAETDTKQQQVYQEQLDKILSGIDFSLRRYESELVPFYELSLLKESGQGERMSLYKDALSVLDNVNSVLYLVNISNKSGKILSGDSELKNAVDVTVHGEEVYVVSDKILKVETGKTALGLVKDTDEEWGDIKELAAYGGNLYVLDTGKNPPGQSALRAGGQIWKYPAIESGFGAKQNYLLADELVGLTDATDLAIDGSIWVTKPGDILRFTLGREDVWQIKDLDKPLGKNLDVHTDDLANNTYILDKDQKRVVVIDKDGVYLAQYFWKNEVEITDFAVSEVIKKILLLSGGKIYGIELK